MFIYDDNVEQHLYITFTNIRICIHNIYYHHLYTHTYILIYSAKFDDPTNIFNTKCDLVFTCSTLNRLQESHITTLANNGCIGIIEGVQQGTTNAAISAGKKRGLHHAPYRATTVGASLFNGATLSLYVTFDTHYI